jgi:hypothetical protein
MTTGHGGVDWIRSDSDTVPANNIVYTYANMRHNVLSIPFAGAHEFSTTATNTVITPSLTGSAEANRGFMILPVDGRVTFPGNLRVWFYCKTANEGATEAVRITAKIDIGYAGYAQGFNVQASASTLVHSATTAWYSVDLTLPDIGQTYLPDAPPAQGNHVDTGYPPLLVCTATVDNTFANTLSLYCVCAYQKQIEATPAHHSLSAVGNLIGSDDKPRSAAIDKLLKDEIKAVRNNRVPRSNIVAHWYPIFYKTLTAAYPAGVNNLGDYKLVKRSGCSTMYVYACVNEYNGGANRWSLKSTMASTTETTSTVTSILRNNDMAYWVGTRFTFSTANTAIEKELNLKLCGKITAGSTAIGLVHGVCVTEKPISTTSVAHTVPDTSQYYPSSYMKSAQVENERATLTSMWQRQPAIAMSDYRFTQTNLPNQLSCNTARYVKDHPCTTAAYVNSSVAGRALVFPSYGSHRLRFRLGLQTYKAANAPEEIEQQGLCYCMFQLSASTVTATNTWAGPAVYKNASGVLTQNWLGDSFGSETYSESNGDIRYFNTTPWLGCPPMWQISAVTTPVSSAQWLSPASTITAASLQNPFQAWIFSWSASTANFIYPTYLTIEEVPLTENEFP